jgi:hypothetical protein
MNIIDRLLKTDKYYKEFNKEIDRKNKIDQEAINNLLINHYRDIVLLGYLAFSLIMIVSVLEIYLRIKGNRGFDFAITSRIFPLVMIAYSTIISKKRLKKLRREQNELKAKD